MKTQEQSSISKEEVPKIKTGLLDKYEKEPVKEVTKEKTKLPQPTGWRMLVLPFRMKERTDGGILMGQETIDRQQVASQCGNVIAMGPDCYNDKERYPMVRGARSVIGWSSHVMQDQESRSKEAKFVF